MNSTSEKPDRKVTARTLHAMKQDGEKFTCLTAYDASFAKVLDQAGIDVILVGDSLGMVIQGHETTVPVTMDHMVYHAANAARVVRHALLMVDMPFMSFSSPAQAMENAARLMQEGGAHMVKLEAGEAQLGIVASLADHGIPVCAHLGLQPQFVHKLGGYRVQGRDPEDARRMQLAAERLQDAGADMLLLECVPMPLAAEITHKIDIPVIGIGAGADTDAQVLVLQDILGITPDQPPRFSKNFMPGASSIQEAVQAYIADVKTGRFPGPEHGFS